MMRRGVLAVVVAAILAGVPGATGAAAASDGLRGPGVPHPATWLGSYATFGGNPWAWCVDAGRAAPEPGYGWASSPVRDPRTSYLLTRYGPSGQVGEHAALSYLVHSSPALPHDARGAVPASPPTYSQIDLPGLVARFAGDAEAQSGPYALAVTVSLEPGEEEGTAAVDLRAASGLPARGWAGTVTLGGPVRWADGAPAARELVTSDTPSSWGIVSTGAGTVSATATVHVPADHVLLHEPGRAGVQRVVAAAPPAEITTEGHAVREPFAPRVVTRTSTAELIGPGELTDALEVSLASGSWLPGHQVTVVSTLWGPFPAPPVEDDGPPDGAPVAGRVQTTVDGPGTRITPPVAVELPGYYVWTEQIAADAQQTGWSGRFGVQQETTVVREPVPVPSTAPPGTDTGSAPVPTAAVTTPSVPSQSVPTATTRPAPVRELPRTGASATGALVGGLLVVSGAAMVRCGTVRRRGRHAAGPVAARPRRLGMTSPAGRMPAAGWVPTRPHA